MPTTPLAGNRASRARNPRDLTGKEYMRQHAEQKAREAAANVDISEIRRAEYQRGYDAGHSAGWMAAVNAIHDMYEREGTSAVEEFMRELDAAEDVA